MPTRMGEPFVQVHSLLGYVLSMMTMPHCDFYELWFIMDYTFLRASTIDSPSFLNFPNS